MPSPRSSHKLHNEVQSCDRFIRNRDEVLHRFLGVPKDCLSASGDAIIDQKPYSQSEETYKYLIASAMSLKPRLQSWAPHWPVKPRNKPILHTPEMVLDLPRIYRNIFGYNIMDWSVTSYLTVAFLKSVYLWHSLTNRTLKIEAKNTSCLKWNTEGTDLFIASRNGSFKYSDMGSGKEVTSATRSSCHLGCFITCSAFHPKSPIMYMGCSLGSVCAYHVNQGLHMINVIHEDRHKNACVMNIALSCDGRHIAMSSMLEFIFIYDTVNFALLFCINMTAPSKAIAWHPWKRNLLVVSDVNGYMALYDTLTSEPIMAIASYLSALDSSFLNITFNPVTAELVTSQRITRTGTNPFNQPISHDSYQLNVLASLNRVVDRMEGHTGPVHFLNWSPDGTMLATAGEDETARIWDFLSPSKNQRTKKVSYKLNYVTASLEVGNRMGLSIR